MNVGWMWFQMKGTCLADAGLFDYFVDSNAAGKGVILVLGIMNCYALSLMWSKYQELKKAAKNNARDERRINDLPSIFDYDDALFAGEGSPYFGLMFPSHGSGP